MSTNRNGCRRLRGPAQSDRAGLFPRSYIALCELSDKHIYSEAMEWGVSVFEGVSARANLFGGFVHAVYGHVFICVRPLHTLKCYGECMPRKLSPRATRCGNLGCYDDDGVGNGGRCDWNALANG